MSKRKVVGPYGAEEWGLKVGSEGWGPTRWEAQHFAFFFPLPTLVCVFLSSFWCLLWNLCCVLNVVFLICLKIACLNDVHRTRPHDNHDQDHDNDHQHDTTTTGWRFGGPITLDGSSPQWVPARTPTVHWVRYDGRPWVARSTPHRAKSRTMTEYKDVTQDTSSDKHGSGASGDHTRQRTTRC